jgi:hypothetical protein
MAFPAYFEVQVGIRAGVIDLLRLMGPDLDELAMKKLFGFLHGCFVVLTFNDLRRLPNVATFEGVNAICRHDPPRNSKELQRSAIWAPVVS